MKCKIFFIRLDGQTKNLHRNKDIYDKLNSINFVNLGILAKTPHQRYLTSNLLYLTRPRISGKHLQIPVHDYQSD